MRAGNALWREQNCAAAARAERESDEARELQARIENSSQAAGDGAGSDSDNEADARLLAEIAELGAQLDLSTDAPEIEQRAILPDEIAEAIADAVDEAVTERFDELEWVT